jgi:membrane-associated protease RseP (regulator of RpoE activity)
MSVMLILGSHEMGHYLMARHHKVDSSLPYFIPIPFGFGTMGAVIRLRGQIPTRNALVDIGAAGPLAGLLIAIPLLIVGLSLSRVVDAPLAPSLFPGPWSLWVLVPKLFTWFHSAAVDGGREYTLFGDNLLTWTLQRAVLGQLPAGKDVVPHPVFFAAWFGMVVTMLNLMPIGQLDAGHLTFAWFGPRAIAIGKAAAVVMVLLVVFSSATWLVWLLVTTRLVGFRHPSVVLPEEPLSPGRKAVCVVCFVFSVLTLMPMVMLQVSL